MLAGLIGVCDLMLWPIHVYRWWYAARASYDDANHHEIEEMLADRIYKLMDSSVGTSSWNEDWRKPRSNGAATPEAIAR